MPTVTKARIKVGALIGQDFRYGKWPATADGKDIDPNMVFNVNRGLWSIEVWADGYGGGINGRPGSYGNGSFHIVKESDLIYIGPPADVG